MKTTAAILSLMVVSSTAFAKTAQECQVDAQRLAKMNLDQAAKKLSFGASNIEDPPYTVSTGAVQLLPGVNETQYTYSIVGAIYKGSYNLKVTVDDTCSARAVIIAPVVN